MTSTPRRGQWQRDDESEFMDYIVPPDDRAVRVRVRPSPAGSGTLITFESESDISDLQSSLRNLATNILSTSKRTGASSSEGSK